MAQQEGNVENGTLTTETRQDAPGSTQACAGVSSVAEGDRIKQEGSQGQKNGTCETCRWEPVWGGRAKKGFCQFPVSDDLLKQLPEDTLVETPWVGRSHPKTDFPAWAAKEGE